MHATDCATDIRSTRVIPITFELDAFLEDTPAFFDGILVGIHPDVVRKFRPRRRNQQCCGDLSSSVASSCLTGFDGFEESLGELTLRIRERLRHLVQDTFSDEYVTRDREVMSQRASSQVSALTVITRAVSVIISD